jgi:hypothetical protein
MNKDKFTKCYHASDSRRGVLSLVLDELLLNS